MTGWLDRLNLRPIERRLLVGMLAVVFFFLNVWFVRPHFKDWGRLQDGLKQSRQKLAQYQAEVAKVSGYEARLKEVEGAGASVLPEEQVNLLITTIQNQATLSRVLANRIDPRNTRRGGVTSTNQFFEEQTVFVSFLNTGDKELLDFMLSLSANSLMVRVRDLDIKPDPSTGNSRLMGTMSLVASYKKTAPTAQSKPASTAKKS